LTVAAQVVHHRAVPKSRDPVGLLNEDFIQAVDHLVDGIKMVKGRSKNLRFESSNPFPVDSIYTDILRPMIQVQFGEGPPHPITAFIERRDSGSQIRVETDTPFPSRSRGVLVVGELRKLAFETPAFRLPSESDEGNLGSRD